MVRTGAVRGARPARPVRRRCPRPAGGAAHPAAGPGAAAAAAYCLDGLALDTMEQAADAAAEMLEGFRQHVAPAAAT
ncbi:hypothetical protein ACFQXA_38680 [Nocardiopsis composta]